MWTQKWAFASRARLKRCRQTCLYQQQLGFPTTSCFKFTAVSQETHAFPPDLRTTTPSQPRGPNPCTAKTCPQINAGMRRRANNEDERGHEGEKQRAGPVPSGQSKDGRTNTPARTGGTSQSGIVMKIWTWRYHHEWLNHFQSVGALSSRKPFHFLVFPDQHPECQLRVCTRQLFSTKQLFKSGPCQQHLHASFFQIVFFFFLP